MQRAVMQSIKAEKNTLRSLQKAKRLQNQKTSRKPLTTVSTRALTNYFVAKRQQVINKPLIRNSI
jgi:hypothetical protein